MNINFASNCLVEFAGYNHHAARRHSGNEGIKPKDTALHFVLLHAAVTCWFKKSSVELPSVQECDARKAECFYNSSVHKKTPVNNGRSFTFLSKYFYQTSALKLSGMYILSPGFTLNAV